MPLAAPAERHAILPPFRYMLFERQLSYHASRYAADMICRYAAILYRLICFDTPRLFAITAYASVFATRYQVAERAARARYC